MSKRLSLSAAAAVVAVMALPAASQASCLHLNHLRTSTVAVVDGTGHALRRIGDGIVRVGDRAFGWIFCKHTRI